MEDIIGTVLFVVDNDDVDEDEEDEEIITPSLPAAWGGGEDDTAIGRLRYGLAITIVV